MKTYIISIIGKGQTYHVDASDVPTARTLAIERFENETSESGAGVDTLILDAFENK